MDQRCSHADRQRIDERCYSGPVAVHPYTAENHAAHGWMTVTEECAGCGWRRRLNVNQHHVEYGVWWDYPAELEAERRAGAERRREIAEVERAADVLMQALARHGAAGSVATNVTEDGAYVALWVQRDGTEVVCGRGSTRVAALQHGRQMAAAVVQAVA